MVEQRPFKPKVVGSIPTAPTSFSLLGKVLQFREGTRGNRCGPHAVFVAGSTMPTTLLFASRNASGTACVYMFIVVRMSACRSSSC